MRLTRVRAVLTAALMALAGITAATMVAAGPASAGSSQVVMVNCAGQGQVRPARYDIGCAANELLAGLRWTSWRSVAFGQGDLKVDNCTPTCAQGKYVNYRILTVLWRARPWPHHAGRQYFTRLTWVFTGNRPGHVPAAQTITLPSF